MSEEILKALMQLFGIITKQGDIITEEQRGYVELFLRQQIGPEQVPEYLTLFDKESGYDKQKADGPKKKKLTSVGDSVRTLAACKKINKTLEVKQKVIVFIRLLELVHADKNDSTLAKEIVDTVATVFKIEGEEYQNIQTFVFSKELESFDSEQFLVADGVNREGEKKQRKRKVRKNQKELDIKAKFLYIENFVGKVVFLKSPSSELYFAKAIGNKNLVMAGLPIVEESVYIFPHGTTIKVPTGKPIYYSEIVARYLKDSIDVNISFNANNIQYVFDNGGIGLRGVTISEETGKLVGIMGASGAGKSTLLNVLNGNEAPTSGTVKINGIDIHKDKDKVEGVIGYVPQDDLLIDELTVYENLYYNGKLCLDNLSDEELHTAIIDLLKSLDLLQTKDLKVGNPLEKTISGGQRKRLNIGLELIREPSVMFVDEPTSGLSSRDSENIMDLLKELGLKGKIIFVVIHQPSSDIYKMFDKMFIMDTGGYPIYYGNPVEAIHYFKRKANQVDSTSGECNTCGNVNPELIFNIIDAKLVDDYGRHLDGRKVSSVQWNRYFKEEIKFEKVEDAKEEPPSTLFIPTKIKQWTTFIKRDVLSKLKNAQYMWINTLEAPLLAFVLAMIVKHSGDAKNYMFYNNDNIPAYMFMSIVVALFMGLTVSAEEIIKDRRILKREKFLNLSKMSYLMSKVGIMTTISAFQTLTFVMVGNMMLDINGMFMEYWFVLFSVSVFANLLGLNISASFNSAVTIYILIPLILIPQMILSGAMFSFDKINKAIGGGSNKVPALAEIMVSRWAFEALAVDQFANNEFEKDLFTFHKAESDLDYKLAYLIPEIKLRINECFKLEDDLSEEANDIYLENVTAIRSAIEEENEGLPDELRFYKTSLISPKNFNQEVATELKYYLDDWTDHYSQMFVKVTDHLDMKMEEMESIAGPENYTNKRNNYSNESLNNLVKNGTSLDKVKIIDGRFEQVSDPIYRTPKQGSFLNAHFYTAYKPLFGNYVYTFWLNLGVIWAMSLLCFISVYNDWLKRTLDYFSNINFSGFKIPIVSGLIESIKRYFKLIKAKKKRKVKKRKGKRKKGEEVDEASDDKRPAKFKMKGKSTSEGEEVKEFNFKRPKRKHKTSISGGTNITPPKSTQVIKEKEIVVPAPSAATKPVKKENVEVPVESSGVSDDEKAERKRAREERKRQRQEAKAAREAELAKQANVEDKVEEAPVVKTEVPEAKAEAVVAEKPEEVPVKVVEEKAKVEVKELEKPVETVEEVIEKTEDKVEVKVEESPVEKDAPAEKPAQPTPTYGANMSDEERAAKEKRREEKRRERAERLNRKLGG